MHEAEEILRNILRQNKKRNNFARKTAEIEIAHLNNANTDKSDTLVPVNSELIQMQLDLKTKSKFLKIIYHFTNNNNDGEVTLISKSEHGISTYPLGRFYGDSIVYFVKNTADIDSLIFEIKTNSAIQIAQLEVIAISVSEYKFNKIKQYTQKFNKLVSKQPHLKAKFFNSLKDQGIRQTLQKTKEKIYRTNEDHNSIEIAGNVSAVSKGSNNALLFICHDAQNAGASILSLNLVKTLKENFNKEMVTILLRGGPLEKEFSKYGTVINLHQSSLSYLENEEEVRGIIQELKNNGIELCISNSIVSNILTKVLYENQIKVISLIHELPTSIFTYDFKKAAEYVCQYSDKIVFPNDFVKNAFKSEFSFAEEKSIVRPQGIYNKRTSQINKVREKEKLCENLNIPQDSTVLLGGGYGDLRKGFDLILSLAKEILVTDQRDNIHFVWVGDIEPILKSWMLHDAKVLGIDSNFHLIDFQTYLLPVLQAADLFLLLSREDPFPSIALEAIDNGTPTVTFSSSGGMAEFISKIGVNPSRYLSIDEMKEEIYRLISSETLYESVSKKGIDLIEKDFDFSDYVSDLLRLGHNVPKSNHRISVIIPNYNYAEFLEERLRSIMYQTVKPAEIIFLDDVSTDNSVQVAEKILRGSDIPYQIIKNTSNVGCFGQWINGIKAASGDLIWIAEADDVCDNRLLETLVPFFNDDEVNLAYAQSEIIDASSNKVGFVYNEYTNDLSTTKWKTSYVLEGSQEVVQGLAIKNTIPNASAVLFRTSALEGIGGELSKFKIAGDWLAYLFAVRIGKIAFSPEVLNYHRRHSSSIVSKSEQKSEYYQEMIAVKHFILDHFEIPKVLVTKFLEHVPNEYKRLGCAGFHNGEINDNPVLSTAYESLVRKAQSIITNTNYLQTQKNILFVAPDFEVGGGQMLVVRLANFFSATQKVYVYNARPWLQADPVIRDMISSSVTVLESSGDPEQLKEYIDVLKIDTVNSHIWWSDKISYQALRNNNEVNWILSMHGCYEALKVNPDWDGEFKKLVSPILNKAKNIIYATDKNLEIFKDVNVSDPSKLRKVYYGYRLESIPPKNKKELGIKPEDFLFGLVSRAIKEKGWEESIKATIELNKNSKTRIHLALVGQSEYALDLKEKYKDYKYIHFITNLTKASEWIGWVKVFDAALLPSYFISESLPNSIIEYLAYNKPVISTRIGEIPQMLYSDKADKYAGILLDLNNERKVEVDELVEAMRTMAFNKELYLDYTNNTKVLFEQFSMKKFGSTYYELY